MPIYEYRRPDGSTFEVLQKFADPTLTEDPETGVPVRRVFRAPAIHFKGSGFHNTDYGTRKRGKDEGGAEGGGEGAKKDGDGAKTEAAAKPAPKPEGAKPATGDRSAA